MNETGLTIFTSMMTSINLLVIIINNCEQWFIRLGTRPSEPLSLVAPTSVPTQIKVDLATHVTLQVQITRFTGMRILHNYRNISRATKQFMMGDRFFEQLMILTLREHFFRPMYYEAPIENTYYMVSAQS